MVKNKHVINKTHIRRFKTDIQYVCMVRILTMCVHRNNLVAEGDAAAATNDGGAAANVVNTLVVVIIHCVRVAQFHSKDFREELLIDFVSARLGADICELESCRNREHGHLTSLNDFV